MQNNNLKFGQLAIKTARLVDAIEKAIVLKTLRISDSSIFVFREMFPAEKKAQEIYIKNLFLYARVKKILKENEALYVKDIETGERIAFYKNNKFIID